MNHLESIVLQIPNLSTEMWETLMMALLSTGLILLMAAGGKYNMGFKLWGISRPLSDSRSKLLLKHIPFFEGLSVSDQKRFGRRVQAFLDSKKFLTRGEVIQAIDEPIKVLVGACVVQLTFESNQVSLFPFKNIVFYADAYYFNIHQQYHSESIVERFEMLMLPMDVFLNDLKNGGDQPEASLAVIRESLDI